MPDVFKLKLASQNLKIYNKKSVSWSHFDVVIVSKRVKLGESNSEVDVTKVVTLCIAQLRFTFVDAFSPEALVSAHLDQLTL